MFSKGLQVPAVLTESRSGTPNTPPTINKKVCECDFTVCGVFSYSFLCSGNMCPHFTCKKTMTYD